MIHTHAEEAKAARSSRHDNYVYDKREIVPRDAAKRCTVAVFEIMPGKAAYPYHWHTTSEEVFYIISGSGLLKSPEGEREVSAGDFLFFPTGEQGAHKLTNTSGEEPLKYIDFDTKHELDVAVYPDSGKVGIWGRDIRQVFRTEDAVDYYDGE